MKNKFLKLTVIVVIHILAISFLWIGFLSLEYKWDYNMYTTFVSYVVMPIATISLIVKMIYEVYRYRKA